MTLILRPAVPNPTDAEAFAVLADEATHGMFRKLLGSAAPRFLAAVFAEAGHDLSHEHVVFAVAEGTIVGMASMHSGVAHRADAGRTRRVVARHAGLRLPQMLAVYLLGRRVFVFMDRLDPGDLYVQMVAVAPESRGRGIGTRLLGAADDAAEATNADRMVLDVDVTNTAAIALYERLGWEIIATSATASRRLDRLRMHRMAKTVAQS